MLDATHSTVRTPSGQLPAQLASEEEAAHGIDDEDAPGTEAGAPHARSLGERHRSGLRRDRHEPVVGYGDAQRTEPVAVERGSARRAVREAERSRTVPGLAEQRAVPVEVAYLGIESRVVLPRRRDENRYRLGEIPVLPAHDEVERVVEDRRVGPVQVERRRKARLDLLRPQPRLHPRDVPVDRVDLAVVAEQPERLRTLPARLGVRGEALVEDRERNLELGILEVGVEVRELARRAEGLVGDRPEREGHDVDAGDALRPTAGAVGASLGVRVLGWSEHELIDAWERGESGHPDRGPVDGDGSPTRGLETLRAARVFDRRAKPSLAEEAHGEPGVGPAAERVRQRQEDAGAVAGDPVSGPRASVPDRCETGERSIEDVPRRAAVHVCDEPDAACVALASWVVEKPLPVVQGGVHLSSQEGQRFRRLSVELVRRRREVNAD